MQYCARTLSHYSTDALFFYVPQLVQALRKDRLRYVEQFILDTGHASQLFAHQIIWNMKANMYKDDDSTVPDQALGPACDRVIRKIVQSFSLADKEFYEREFSFFDEVTGISGKLRPYIKKSKLEKKRKIDEELLKIKVQSGVYLPSNPDSIVVDIDYDSGRPLQSHAKVRAGRHWGVRPAHQSPAGPLSRVILCYAAPNIGEGEPRKRPATIAHFETVCDIQGRGRLSARCSGAPVDRYVQDNFRTPRLGLVPVPLPRRRNSSWSA